MVAQPYVPDATGWINAFEAGQRGAMTRRKQQAAQQIGGLMASGDYEGAAAAAYGAGDYATGSQIEQAGAGRAAAARKATYGRQFAEGKGSDAVKSAYGAGDFEIGGDLQKAIDSAGEREKAFMKEKADRIAAIVAPLGDIPETDMAARKAYIATHAAELMSAGYTAEQLDTFEPTNVNLAPIYSQALGLKDYLTQQDRLRDDARAERQIGESERHNRVSEGVSAGSLAVSRGNLAQRQTEHAARMAGKGGYASPGGSYDDIPSGGRVVR